MGTQRFCSKNQLFFYFVNKIFLPCCCILLFGELSSCGFPLLKIKVQNKDVRTGIFSQAVRLPANRLSASAKRGVRPDLFTLS